MHFTLVPRESDFQTFDKKMKYLILMLLVLTGCTSSPDTTKEFRPSPSVKHPLAPQSLSSKQTNDPLLSQATEAVHDYLAKRQYPHEVQSIQKKENAKYPHYIVFFEPVGEKVYMPLSAILIDGKWEMRWAIH
jgi:hypothetical protein